MSFANIKSLRQERGFTIVELLIVVVVIGILAAISVVSYTGITQQANTAKARSNAASVQRVAEVHFATNGSYPTTVEAFTDSGLEATLPSGINLVDALDSDQKRLNGVVYETNAAGTAAQVTYWDFTTNSAAPSIVISSAAPSPAVNPADE